MSVLSDIYISSIDEAVNYDTAPNSFTERAQYKGMTPLELSTLWAIMRGVEWDVAMINDFSCLLQVDGGERLVHSFPMAMVTALDQLTGDQIRDFSEKWAATEELVCSPSEIQPVVAQMSRLARAAASSGSGLFIWNSV
jgi:hypothetical protein